MLTYNEIKESAKLRGLKENQEEKRYIQCIALSAIYNELGNALVFKGGTSLSLLRGLSRFSEDLDFTMQEHVKAAQIIGVLEREFARRAIMAQVRIKKSIAGIAININAQGPRYVNPPSVCSIRVEVSGRDDLALKPEPVLLRPSYPDVNDVQLTAMDMREAAAEKVRAIIMRNYARDVFDLAFLLEKGAMPSRELINKKLIRYRGEFDWKEFEKAVDGKKGIWQSELAGLVPRNLQPFAKVKEEVLKGLKYLKG